MIPGAIPFGTNAFSDLYAVPDSQTASDYYTWINSDAAREDEKVWAVEVDRYISNALGTLQIADTLYFSSHGMPDPEVSPVRPYPAQVVSPFSIRVTLPESNYYRGQAYNTIGVIQIAFDENDDLLTEGSTGTGYDSIYEGHQIRVKLGNTSMTAYSQFGTVLVGTVDRADWDEQTLTLSIRDRSSILDTPIQPNKYAGTGGSEGDTDLVGKPKPLLYGRCYNIEPVLVDAANLLYQIHNGPLKSVDAVYFNGVAATGVQSIDGTYPDDGTNDYSVDLSTGFLTLYTAPLGQVTCDVRGDNASGIYIDRAGDIIYRALTSVTGWSADDIDTASIAAFNGRAPWETGVYTGANNMSCRELISIVEGHRGWWRFSETDQLQFGVHHSVGASAYDTIDENDIISISRRSPMPPVYRGTIRYQRNYTVQDESVLAGAVTDAHRAFAVEEWRSNTGTTSVSTSAYPLADEVEWDSYIMAYADAANCRIGFDNTFFKGMHLYDVTITNPTYRYKIGDTYSVTYSRWGLDAGRLMVLVGYSIDSVRDQATLVFWTLDRISF